MLLDLPYGLRRPDPTVLAALQRVNRNLDVRWLDDRGCWCIFERNRRGEWEEVTVLQDDEGNALDFDMSVVERMARTDTWKRRRGVDSVLADIERSEQAHRDELRKKQREASHEAARTICRRGSGFKTFDMGRAQT